MRGHARKHLVLVDAENGVTQFTEWAGSLDRDPNATLAERALAIVKNALEGRPYWFIRRTQGIVEAIVVRAPPVEGGAHGDRVESLVQGFSP